MPSRARSSARSPNRYRKSLRFRRTWSRWPSQRDSGFVEEIVREATGAAPRKLRFLETGEGLVAFLTLGLDPTTTLADAHRRASEVEERIRRERPEIADVIVHTEP